MRKDSDFSLTTHALRTTVSVRKGVLYVLEKDSVKYRKLVLYAFFSASQRTRKFKISCCVQNVLVNYDQTGSSQPHLKDLLERKIMNSEVISCIETKKLMTYETKSVHI